MQQQDVAGALRRDGFCLVRALAPESFLALASSLGEVVAVEAIELRPGVGSYACSPGPVPFHTDHPAVAVAAWHCVRQDSVDGASLLVDAGALVGRLSAATVARLEALHVAHPPLARGHEAGFAPVLEPRSGGHDVYVPPIVRPRSSEPSSLAAYGAFVDQLRAVGAATPIRLRLEPTDALFVDNRRVLHGRAALRPDSPRSLRRAWIRRPSARVEPAR